LVNHAAGEALLRRLRAAFVTLEFILRKMRPAMVNARLLIGACSFRERRRNPALMALR
jgi:hypothetical protein